VKFEDVLDLLRSEPDDPPREARYIFTSDSVSTADDLLVDDSIEILKLSRELDPHDIPRRRHLIDFDVAVGVLETWSDWRDGRVPTPREAATAIVWYVDHDAFIPIDRT